MLPPIHHASPGAGSRSAANDADDANLVPDGSAAPRADLPAPGSDLQGLTRLASSDAPACTLFFTPFGQELCAGIDAFMALPALEKISELHTLVDRATARLLRRPGPAVLLLGSGHYVSSSLGLFHAAADACRKYRLPLFIEHSPASLRQLRPVQEGLRQLPRLARLLGGVPLESRTGQEIAWRYIRSSGGRGPLQKVLPETLAGLEMAQGGLDIHPVDSENREALEMAVQDEPITPRDKTMAQSIHAALGNKDRGQNKGIFVGGMAHLIPMHLLLNERGLQVRCLGVLDETSNCANRLYDGPPDEVFAAYHAAFALNNNGQVPGQEKAGRQTAIYRVGFDLSPFV